MTVFPTIEALEERWEAGNPPDLGKFVGDLPVSQHVLFGLISEDLRRCIEIGKNRRAEFYFARFPKLTDDERLDVIYQEFLLRETYEQRPELREYRQRFPRLGEAINRQLTLHIALEEVESASTTPDSLRDFQLLEEIGSGGMGRVYRAHHSRLHRDVAIKILPPDQFQDAAAVARFEREMQAIGQLMHPNIVQAMDAGVENGCHYLALEFVDGVDAHRLSREYGELAVADACEVARQAAMGLQHAHSVKLIHRDIKPSNLLVSKDGIVKVADMGLALLQQPGGARHDLTSTGQIMGTLDYIAPEQIEDMHDVDTRADLYSLGCTLYQLLTGAAPFAGTKYKSVLRKLKAHEQDSPQAVSAARTSGPVPPQLQEVVHQLLAKDPGERIQTAGELAELLERFTVGSELSLLIGQLDSTATSLERGEAKTELVSDDSKTMIETSAAVDTRPSRRTAYPSTSIPDSTTISAQLRKRSSTRKTPWLWIILGGLVAIGLTTAMFTTKISNILSGRGVVVVRTDEPAVVVSIARLEAGGERTIVKRSSERTFSLAANEQYRVYLEEPATDIEFSSEPFAVTSGGETTLDLTSQLAAVRARLGPSVPTEAAPPDTMVRSAADPDDPFAGRSLTSLSPTELSKFFKWAESHGLDSPSANLTEEGSLKPRFNMDIDADKGKAGYLIDRVVDSGSKIFALHIHGSRPLETSTLAAIKKSGVGGLHLNVAIDDDGVAQFPDTIRRHLHLSQHVGPTNLTVELLSSRLSRLTILSLPNVAGISPEKLALLSRLKLNAIGLGAGATDEHTRVLRRFDTLETVSLQGSLLTDESLKHLSRTQLTTIRINAPMVTKAGIEQFIEARPQCKVISAQFGEYAGQDHKSKE